jgi:UDP:flavonoid glycosyltransferase YjiC (YdhE family)
VFISVAYLGDVAPFVAPANLLAERGHDVTFLTPAGFHPLMKDEKFKLATYPLDMSSARMHRDPEHQKLMRHPVRNAGRLARYWMRISFVEDVAAVRESLLREFDGADVVVSHPTTCTVSAPVAAHLGIPLVVGNLFPMMVPTSAWTPPLGRSSPRLPSVVNRTMWRVLATASSLGFYDRHINKFRRSLGQRPIFGNALKSWIDATRTVMLVSPHYYGKGAADWPAITWAGFSHWPGPADQRVDPAVDEFLDGGDAPVLVTLGTSAATNAGAQFAVMADGIDRLGLRSLLLVGDKENLSALGARAGAFEFAPVGRVLSRCRVAVVSGALGTVGAALAAGVPVVVVPQLFDQFWHGGQVERLGVGKMVRNAKQVAAAVAEIESDPSYRQRAQALSAAMANEDAPRVLADEVESLL